MSNESKLYVGNLDFSTNDQGLQEAFSGFGDLVSASVVQDKMTGQSRGFGFVEFRSGADAQKAIEAMHGTSLQGRSLTVSVARPREGGGGGGGGGGRNFGGGGGRYRN